MPGLFPPKLARLVQLWSRAIAPPRRSAIAVSLVAVAFVGAHYARVGTTTARWTTGMVIVATLVMWATHALWRHWVHSHPQRAARHVIGKLDPQLGERTARALRLAHDQHHEQVTTELAQLHLERLLARTSAEGVEEAAEGRGRRWKTTALLLGGVALGALVAGPVRVVEGLNVLVARDGRAPLPMAWIEAAIWQVEVPRYLRKQGTLLFGFEETSQPRGTVLTLQAQPRHDGRHLVLTDGRVEVAFADNAHGGIVARWVLSDSVDLEVGARFGDVLIPQGERFHVTTIEDEAPRIEVADAPRTLRLLEHDGLPIAIEYQVVDDHGLTQVDLVLRAGDREERRVLRRLDGQEAVDRGSSMVQVNDKFVRSSYLPIEIVVEARDNDPIKGPKWGRSAAITLVPPAVGEPEALRFSALKKLRDQAVDVLAGRISFDPGDDKHARDEHAAKEQRAQAAFGSAVKAALGQRHGGLSMPRALAALYVGHLDRLEKLVAVDCIPGSSKTACVDNHRKVREGTEATALAFDDAMRLLDVNDAASVAKRLSRVAEQAEQGAKLVRSDQRERGLAKLHASLEVLSGGAASLMRLDRLGRDLGEVTSIGVRRIERTLQRDDLVHAELAARDLALRLRRPHPSFSGGGSRHGTEAGSTMDDPAQSGSSATDELGDKQDALEELAREHADEMDKLREELARHAQETELQDLREQAREHAQQVREAVRDLPSTASDSSSARGAASMARDNAERMADALDRADLGEASNSGKSAVAATEQAGRLAKEDAKSLFGGDPALEKDVGTAQEALREELRWIEEQMQRLRRAQAEKARDALERSARSEQQLAEQAGRVADEAREGQAPLPEATAQMLEQAKRKMEDAARALRGLDPERGSALQNEAQTLLEMAKESYSRKNEPSTEGQPEGTEGDEGAFGGEPVDIPGADAHRGPEDFRKRVIEGLAGSSEPRLKEAVKRYAEGLLR